MNDFYEFDERSHRREGTVWRYVAVALAFLLMGAVVMYYIFPFLPENQEETGIAQDNTPPGPEGSISGNNEEEEKEQEKDSTPQLGYRGDLFISSDNPVVEIAQKVGPAVVGITNKSVAVQRGFFGDTYEYEKEAYGSGIVISEEGYIVTNEHVIANSKELYVILQGGETVKAQLIGADATTDVAVIKIDYPNLTVAPLGDSDKVQQGEMAIAIGNPLGHELAGTITVGVISAVNRTLKVDTREYKLLQTDAAINPGNSGGALINSRGEVIGMNTIKTMGQAEGLGFAIPSNVFLPIARELIEKGSIERPGIGVIVYEVTQAMIDDYGYPPGVIIDQLTPQGAADKAGLLPRDVIIGINDSKITTITELKDNINKYKVGDVVRFRIWRDGKEFTVPIKLQQLS